jgi:hypothetical protein
VEPASDAQPVTKRRFEWLRKAGDRVPTKWFAAIGTVLFLAATAAFGGLATVRQPPPAELGPGDVHRNDQLELAVQRAVLVDELPEAGIVIEPGQRVLAVVVDVENRWTEPLETFEGRSVSDAVVLERDPGHQADEVARFDDGTFGPTLQPGVPATLVLAWAVDGRVHRGGDALRIVLNDETLYTASFVSSGQSWEDPVPAAVVTVEIEDVGAGLGEDAEAAASGVAP